MPWGLLTSAPTCFPALCNRSALTDVAPM
jgi:hypothetical protein